MSNLKILQGIEHYYMQQQTARNKLQGYKSNLKIQKSMLLINGISYPSERTSATRYQIMSSTRNSFPNKDTNRKFATFFFHFLGNNKFIILKEIYHEFEFSLNLALCKAC